MKAIIMITIMIAVAIGIAFAITSTANARDQIRIVGSSTVYPFSTIVAERFGKKLYRYTAKNGFTTRRQFKTPVVESTGSGGGLKLFCNGIGIKTPDITNSSRRIKKSEVERCQKNGVKVLEYKIGYDGIVIANSKKAPKMNLSLRDIYLALAKQVPTTNGMVANPNVTWQDVNPNLPKVKIRVLGPPPTSGTRDAFNELAMEGGCKTYSKMKAMKNRKAYCHGIREDGAWIEAGENDNLIVQKLGADPTSFGVFGFSFLDQNRDKVQGANINGTEPTFENISSQKYPVSRSLFFYVKGNHVGLIPGLKNFVKEFMSRRAIGRRGYLVQRGLIPLGKT